MIQHEFPERKQFQSNSETPRIGQLGTDQEDERLDVRRSRCSASHSEVYDALQVLGLGCALKLDVHNRKIWNL